MKRLHKKNGARDMDGKRIKWSCEYVNMLLNDVIRDGVLDYLKIKEVSNYQFAKGAENEGAASYDMIYKWLRGENNLSEEKLFKVLDFLELDITMRLSEAELIKK